VLVTVNRYVAVCRPFTATDTNAVKRQARLHVAIVTVFSVLFNISRFFEWEFKEVENGDMKEFPTWLAKNDLYQV